MSKILAFNLVVVLIALLPPPSLTQSDNPRRKQSIRMKSFKIAPQNEAQVQAFKNFQKSRTNAENMYFQGGRIQENNPTEILVPVMENGESEFLEAMAQSGLSSGLSDQSYSVKLKFYENLNQPQQSSPAQNYTGHILRGGSYPAVSNTYRLQNYNSRRCMTVEGLNGVNSAVNGIVDLYACTSGAANQDWNLQTPYGYNQNCGTNVNCKSYYHFVNQNAGTSRCLTVGTNLQGDGNDTPVLSNTCRYPVDRSQLWYVDRFTMKNTVYPENLKGNFYQIQAGKGGRCLSNRGDGQGAQFYLYDCNPAYTNQYFGFF